jgi:hypothetical protein
MLLLASRDLRPRRRARDQQADLVGLELKRRVLEELASVDPEPSDLEATLLQIITGSGGAPGPVRAVAAMVREEWAMACASPDWVAQLIAEAVGTDRSGREGPGRG